MSSTGNVFAGAGASVDRAAATLWTNPGNITADDTTNATSTVPTDYLIASSFGFSSSVPLNVSIRGITVRVEMSETGSGSSNYVVQLSTDTTPTLVGNVSGTITVTTGPTVSTTGGIADLWGTTLTAAQVRSSGFGVTLWSTDTINGLQCDYITIAIEWTDVPQAWSDRQYFRKRRNFTNRRLREAVQPDSLTAAAPASVDRALEHPFRTITLRSRRALSIGWMGALTAVTPAEPQAQPVSAWLAAPQQRVRRNTTERRALRVEPLHWPYIAPELGAIPAPKAIRIERKRRLRLVTPLDYFPPPTGPPTAQGFPAWAWAQLPATFQDRHALGVPEHNVYPEAPKPEPNFCARIPGGFHKRKKTARRLLEVELSQWTATPGGSVSNDRALDRPFVTRTLRSRRLQTAGSGLESIPVAPPPPPSEAPVSAVTLTKIRKRKARQGLFLSGGGVVEASVQPQFPSFAPLQQKKRKSLERRLLRADGLPSAPATPAVQAQPETAWRRPKQHRVERERTLQKAAPQLLHPATPAVPAQPESAWRAQPQFWAEQHRKLQPAAPQLTHPRTMVPDVGTSPALAIKRRETKRKLREVAHNPSYPSAPTPGQPESAWRLKVANRSEQQRKLLPQAPQITHPRTLVSDVATIVVRALKRRDTKRTLRRVAHAPLYTQTPVAFQQPTSWKLAEGFRRHGWRVLRKVLGLDEHPESPNRSEPKPNRTVKVKTKRTTAVKSPSRIERTKAAKRTEKP